MALNSTSVIRFVDLLCEGPIAGLVGTEEGIFLDETPIRTGSGRNFASQDVSYDFKPGGRTQTQVAQGGNGTSTVSDINTEIGENYSETLNANNQVTARDYGSGQLIRQITDTDVESFELLFSIPRMFSTAQEGLAKGQFSMARFGLQSMCSLAGQHTTRFMIARSLVLPSVTINSSHHAST